MCPTIFFFRYDLCRTKGSSGVVWFFFSSLRSFSSSASFFHLLPLKFSAAFSLFSGIVAFLTFLYTLLCPWPPAYSWMYKHVSAVLLLLYLDPYFYPVFHELKNTLGFLSHVLPVFLLTFMTILIACPEKLVPFRRISSKISLCLFTVCPLIYALTRPFFTSSFCPSIFLNIFLSSFFSYSAPCFSIIIVSAAYESAFLTVVLIKF